MKIYVLVAAIVATFAIGFAEMLNRDLFSVKHVGPFFILCMFVWEMVEWVRVKFNFESAAWWFGSEWLVFFTLVMVTQK